MIIKSICFSGFRLLLLAAVCCSLIDGSATLGADARKKIVLIGGSPSHGPGEHEHNAAVLLLQKCLNQLPSVDAVVFTNGWPKDITSLKEASSIVLEMDGSYSAFEFGRDQVLGDLVKKGVGLVCIHLATEVGKAQSPQFLDWLGAYYENGFSTNPDWTAEFKSLPEHPITHGVKPFSLLDEWYFNLRFKSGMQGIKPILLATPSDEARSGKTAKPPGVRPHIIGAKGQEEILAWAMEREGGGKSFGITGGHFHRNWAHEDFRKLVLNAILWTAQIDVPAGGVMAQLTSEDLNANLDQKAASKPRQSTQNADPDLSSSGDLAQRLPQKISLLQTKAQAALQSGKDMSDVMKIMEEFEKLMQGGQPEDAEKVLDKALALLKDVKTDGKTPTQPNPNAAQQTPPSSLMGKMNKIQNFFEIVQTNMSQVPALMQDGKMEEAQKALEKALALLGEKPEEGFETLGADPQIFQEKMARIQTLLMPLGQEMQKIPALAQEGKVEEAEKEADKILKKIEKLNPKAFAELKETAPSNQQSATPLPESLQKKMALMQKAAQAKQADGKDLSEVGAEMQKLGPLIQKGEMKEAEVLLDEIIKKLN